MSRKVIVVSHEKTGYYSVQNEISKKRSINRKKASHSCNKKFQNLMRSASVGPKNKYFKFVNSKF